MWVNFPVHNPGRAVHVNQNSKSPRRTPPAPKKRVQLWQEGYNGFVHRSNIRTIAAVINMLLWATLHNREGLTWSVMNECHSYLKAIQLLLRLVRLCLCSNNNDGLSQSQLARMRTKYSDAFCGCCALQKLVQNLRSWWSWRENENRCQSNCTYNTLFSLLTHLSPIIFDHQFVTVSR